MTDKYVQEARRCVLALSYLPINGSKHRAEVSRQALGDAVVMLKTQANIITTLTARLAERENKND